MEEGKHYCIICKKKLTNPKSIQQKMGKRCLYKYKTGVVGIQSAMA